MAGSGAGASYFLKLSIKRPAQIPGPALPLHRIRPGVTGIGEQRIHAGRCRRNPE